MRHGDEAALARAPLPGYADGQRQQRWLFQDHDELLDQVVESEQIDGGLVVGPQSRSTVRP
ncbi:MAG: hypothetical protein LC777_05050, partial [Actinobacteria bacterium]|nr:hypothetical protein [Actinomycetota bacterium]